MLMVLLVSSSVFAVEADEDDAVFYANLYRQYYMLSAYNGYVVPREPAVWAFSQPVFQPQFPKMNCSTMTRTDEKGIKYTMNICN